MEQITPASLAPISRLLLRSWWSRIETGSTRPALGFTYKILFLFGSVAVFPKTFCVLFWLSAGSCFSPTCDNIRGVKKGETNRVLSIAWLLVSWPGYHGSMIPKGGNTTGSHWWSRGETRTRATHIVYASVVDVAQLSREPTPSSLIRELVHLHDLQYRGSAPLLLLPALPRQEHSETRKSWTGRMTIGVCLKSVHC